MGFLPKVTRKTDADRAVELERELIRLEAKIGGELFGPVKQGHRRDFFCLDEHTWIWHEEWIDAGQRKAVTTRYDVRPNGILKSQAGQPYRQVQGDEGRNLQQAVAMYSQQVNAEYQRILQAV